jgi:hypothetical protein
MRYRELRFAHTQAGKLLRSALCTLPPFAVGEWEGWGLVLLIFSFEESETQARAKQEHPFPASPTLRAR